MEGYNEIPVGVKYFKIPLGRVSETLVTQVIIDCTAWVEQYGSGTAELVHKRNGDIIGYRCLETKLKDNKLTWTVTSDDTACEGRGQLQLRWYVDDALKQSAIFATEVLPSLTASEDEPAEIRSSLDLLLQAVEDSKITDKQFAEMLTDYLDRHPVEAPVTSVNKKIGAVVITAQDLGALTEHQDISGKANAADLANVAVSGDYNDLVNKPAIPSKTSDLINDSGFLSEHQSLEGYATEEWVDEQGFLMSYTETDPTVPAWAKAPRKPTYTASEVGALPVNTFIPSRTSDLTNDSGFLTQHQDISGKEDKITVQTMTSADVTVTLQENIFYIFPEMASLTINCPVTGMYAFRFTSGATPTVLSVPGITMPDDFEVEANCIYEVNIYQGLGVVASWVVTA